MAKRNNERLMLTLLAIILIFHCIDGARARGGGSLSDLKMTKHTIKSIKSVSGSIIDCVDIYKQPAFDHPLLRNHTIQMTPSNYDPKKASSLNPIEQSWHKSGSCPEGTIPIVRTQEGDSVKSNGLKASVQGRVERAKQTDRRNEIHGAEAFINAWKPFVERNEYSSSSVFIGRQNTADMIDVGWRVDPGLNGDNLPYLYGYWASDNGGCFNLQCSGYVQVDKSVALGAVLNGGSVYDGDQLVFHAKIQKDPKSGHWWFHNHHVPHGYWPNSLFKNMGTSANYAEWGGQVLNTGGKQHTKSQMGSGHFPYEGPRRAAFFANCLSIDTNDKEMLPSLSPIADISGCYDVAPADPSDGGGFGFYYGGAGGGWKGC